MDSQLNKMISKAPPALMLYHSTIVCLLKGDASLKVLRAAFYSHPMLVVPSMYRSYRLHHTMQVLDEVQVYNKTAVFAEGNSG